MCVCVCGDGTYESVCTDELGSALAMAFAPSGPMALAVRLQAHVCVDVLSYLVGERCMCVCVCACVLY